VGQGGGRNTGERGSHLQGGGEEPLLKGRSKSSKVEGGDPDERKGALWKSGRPFFGARDSSQCPSWTSEETKKDDNSRRDTSKKRNTGPGRTLVEGGLNRINRVW